jgi:DNA processing protein
MSTPLPDTVRDLLALHLVPGIGPRLTAALLGRFGSASAVLQATPGQLREIPHIGGQLADSIFQALRAVDVGAELDLMAHHEVRLLAYGTVAYPDALATIPDPPHLIYLRGQLEPGDTNAVAVVGSRQCTSYGKRIAERLAIGLARAGVTVISGLARGIDGAAHRGALQAGGRTLAVLAGGLSKIYPPEHAELAREVAAAGALLSEAAMRMEPLAGMFPARNRIISGLSLIASLEMTASGRTWMSPRDRRPRNRLGPNGTVSNQNSIREIACRITSRSWAGLASVNCPRSVQSRSRARST